MTQRPFLLWLAATHALALTACNTRCDPAKRPYGTFDLTAFEELPQADLPGPGSLQGITGTTVATGLYMFHDHGWNGYGDLCGMNPVLFADDISDPYGDGPLEPYDTVVYAALDGTLVFLDCTADDPFLRPGIAIQNWIAPVETVQEAYMVARQHFAGAEPRGEQPVLFTQDAEGFTVAIPNGLTWANLLHISEDADVRQQLDEVCPRPASPAFSLGGRLTTGVRLADGHPGHTFAAYAGMEAAAVLAFERMADQLDHLGAPEHLIAACHDAADEERIHADLLTSFAADRSLQPVPVELDPFAPVDLFTFALDNRLEGCIRETFGAMVGRFQADHLPPGRLRDIWQQIATDEEGHAALSWRIAAWAEAQLTDAQREVLDARSEALLAGLVDGHDAPAGLPVVPETALHVYGDALRDRVLGRRAA